jgi:hypothetical protein
MPTREALAYRVGVGGYRLRFLPARPSAPQAVQGSRECSPAVFFQRPLRAPRSPPCRGRLGRFIPSGVLKKCGDLFAERGRSAWC